MFFNLARCEKSKQPPLNLVIWKMTKNKEMQSEFTL